MAGVLGSLVVTLGLDAASFAAGLTKSEYEARRWRDSIRNLSRDAGLALAGAAGVAATALVAVTKNALDSAEAINKLSQRTGVVAESLSALRFAAELGNVSAESFATNLARLARNVSEAAQGTGEQAAAFRVLGVEVKNADGSLRGADAILADIATKFSSYRDGVEKTALALAIFGKSGAELIPMLNMGAEGLQRAREEAQALGIVISQQTAQAAEEFNDTLLKLSKGTQGLGLIIAQAALPYLQVFASELLAFVRNSDDAQKAIADLRQAFEGLAVGTNTLLFGFSTTGRALGAFAAQVRLVYEVLRAPPSELIETAKRNWSQITFISDAFRADQERAFESFREFNRKLEAAGREAAQAAQGERPSNAAGSRGAAQPFKPPAPRLPGPARAPAAASAITEDDRLLRRELQGQLDAITDFARGQQEAYAFANDYARGVYEQGLADLGTYFDAQRRLRAQALATTVQALDQEIAALEAYRQAATKPSERADAENRIAQASAKREEATRRAARQAVLDAQGEAREVQALAARYAELQETVLRLRGQDRQADLLAIERQVGEARLLLVQSGQDPSQADTFGQLLRDASALRQVREQYTRLLERTRIAEEGVLLAAKASGASELDVLASLKAARGQALQQMAEIVQRAQELARALGNPDAQLFADQLAAAFARAVDEADPLLTRVRDLSREMGQAISSSFEDAIVRGASLRELLQSIAQDILRITTRELVTKPLTDLLSTSLFPFVGKLFGGGKAIGGPVEPGKIYRVAERRPEMLTVDGEQFLLMGNFRGQIDPNPDLRALAPASSSTDPPLSGGAQAAPGTVYHVTQSRPELLSVDSRPMLLMGSQRGQLGQALPRISAARAVEPNRLYDLTTPTLGVLRVGYEEIVLPTEAVPRRPAAARGLEEGDGGAGDRNVLVAPQPQGIASVVEVAAPSVPQALRPVSRSLQGRRYVQTVESRERQVETLTRPLAAVRHTPAPVVDGPTGAHDVFEMLLGAPKGGERRPMLLNMGREQYLFMGDRPGRIDPNPAQEEVERLLGAELARSAEPKAIGGAVRRGGLYRVAERRPELLDVQGERFVLMGSQRVRSAAAGRQAASGASNVTVNVTVPAGTPVQTANQIAAAVARKLRVATLRNA